MQRGLIIRLTLRLLHVQQFGVAGAAVGQPQRIARRRRNQLSPPLPRQLIRQNTLRHQIADCPRRKEHEPRTRVAVRRAIFGFHEREVGLRRQSIEAGEVRHDLARLFSVGVRHVRARAEVERADHAFGCHLLRLPLNDGDASGKRLMRVVERVHGLVGARMVHMRNAAGDDVEPGWHGDAGVGGKAVRSVAGYREPAARVHQIGIIGVDSGEPDAVDGRIFGAGKAAVVGERQSGGFTFRQRFGKREPHGEVLLSP